MVTFTKKTQIFLLALILFLSAVILTNPIITVQAEMTESKELKPLEKQFIEDFIDFLALDQSLYAENTVDYVNEDFQAKFLYDINNNETFILVYSKIYNCYGIANILSKNFFEKSPNKISPYDLIIDRKCAYYGIRNYGYYNQNMEACYINGTPILHEEKEALQNQLNTVLAQENIALLMTDTETRVKRAKFASEPIKQYFTLVLKNTGATIIKSFNGVRDLHIPYNTGTSCGPNAATIIMQYYQRNGVQTIPNTFMESINMYTGVWYDGYDKGTENSSHKVNYDASRKLYLTDHLSRTLDTLTNAGLAGENVASTIAGGINAFYNKYGTDVQKKLAMSYNIGCSGIVGCIDSGKLAIMTTTTQNGYYSPNIDSANPSWLKTSAGTHNMVVYGYCYTAKGTLKDFICHSGWHTQYTERMYVYKIGTASNITEV